MSNFFFQRASLAVRGRCNFKHIAIAACAVVFLVGAVTGSATAGLIRVDGDYMYLTEDFAPDAGVIVPLPVDSDQWRVYAINADYLWYPLSHSFPAVFPEAARFAETSFIFADYSMKLALISNEEEQLLDGMALAIRPGHADSIVLPSYEILEFSCDVFVGDSFWGDFYDYHSIDFIGTEGRFRFFLPLQGGMHHVSVNASAFEPLIGDLDAVWLQSPYSFFDNLTVKTWRNGVPPIPEPGLATLLAGCLGLCALRRKRTENTGRTYSGLRAQYPILGEPIKSHRPGAIPGRSFSLGLLLV